MGNGPDNYTQEECEEGIDRMMTEPTPEEVGPRAKKCEYCRAEAGEICRGYRAFGNIPQYHTERWRAALRAAVEADKEACADLAESGHFDIGCTAIEAEGIVRRTRDAIAAGIRARGESDG
jgi:hypothetical protein